MKKANLLILFALFFSLSVVVSCNNKSKDTTTDTPAPAVVPDTPVVATPAPVIISGDDALKKGVTDATKDFPNVKAEVSDSVISLTGEIKRSDWQKLMPTLNSLRPKRINSAKLTIK